jgi:hypothetical protein
MSVAFRNSWLFESKLVIHNGVVSRTLIFENTKTAQRQIKGWTRNSEFMTELIGGFAIDFLASSLA